MRLLYIIGQQDYGIIDKSLKDRMGKSVEVNCIMWLEDLGEYLSQGNSFDRCIVLNPKRTIQNYSIDILKGELNECKWVLEERGTLATYDIIFCVSNEEEGEIAIEATSDMQGNVLIPEVETFKSSDLFALSVKDFATLDLKYKCHSVYSLRVKQNLELARHEAEPELEDNKDIYDSHIPEVIVGGVGGLEDTDRADEEDYFLSEDEDMENTLGSLFYDTEDEEEQGKGVETETQEAVETEQEIEQEEEQGESWDSTQRTETLTDGFSDQSGSDSWWQNSWGTEGIQSVSEQGFDTGDDDGFDSNGFVSGEAQDGIADTLQDSDGAEITGTQETEEEEHYFTADQTNVNVSVDTADSVLQNTGMGGAVVDEFELPDDETNNPTVAEKVSTKKEKKKGFGFLRNNSNGAKPIKDVQAKEESETSIVKDTSDNSVSDVSKLFQAGTKTGNKNAKSIANNKIKSRKVVGKSKSGKEVVVKDSSVMDVLKEKSKKGCLMLFTGTHGTGKTLLSANIANLISRLGYTVLILDLDTVGKGQSYINSSCFELIHGADTCANKVVNALNGTESALYKNLDIIRPGLHMLTSTLGSDSTAISEQINTQNFYNLIYTLKSEYNFIIVDVGTHDLTSRFKEFVDSADYVLCSVEANTHGVMDFLLSYTNINNEIVQARMFKRTKIILNKEQGFKSFYGRKVEDTHSLLSALDDMVKLITGISNSQISFTDLDVVSILESNHEFEQFWGTNKYISDTEAGEALFTSLLQECLK